MDFTQGRNIQNNRRSMPKCRTWAQRGFTLVEAMITISIFSILTSTAIPAWQDFALNNCLTTTNNSLITGFNLARSEAAKRGRPVRIASFAGDANWEQGWRIEDAATAELLREGRNSCPRTQVVESAETVAFVYQPTGVISTPANFTICDSRADERERLVTISAVGRPNTTVSQTPGSFACPTESP